jgi:hypothetical protein
MKAAAKEGHTETVDLLLGRGAATEARDNVGWLPWPRLCEQLIYAASKGHTETVDFLLRRGAAIEARDNVGNTALMRAASNGHSKMISLLLGRGAAIQARDNDGGTALSIAWQHNHHVIVETLQRRVLSLFLSFFFRCSSCAYLHTAPRDRSRFPLTSSCRQPAWPDVTQPAKLDDFFMQSTLTRAVHFKKLQFTPG